MALSRVRVKGDEGHQVWSTVTDHQCIADLHVMMVSNHLSVWARLDDSRMSWMAKGRRYQWVSLDGILDVDGSDVLATCSDDDVLLAASDVKESL